MTNQLILRRKKLFKAIEADSIIVIHSGFAPFKSADSSYEFNVNHNFYYLAGIDQEDLTLVIGNSHGEYYEKLFIDAPDEMYEKYYRFLYYLCSSTTGYLQFEALNASLPNRESFINNYKNNSNYISALSYEVRAFLIGNYVFNQGTSNETGYYDVNETYFFITFCFK